MDELNQVLNFSEEMREAEFEKNCEGGRSLPVTRSRDPGRVGQAGLFLASPALLPFPEPSSLGKLRENQSLLDLPVSFSLAGLGKVLPMEPNPPGIYKHSGL